MATMDLKKNLQDKTILITGGTGSFGKACAKYLLENDLCKKVIIFSRDEWKQWEMKESISIFNHPKIRYFLGDVRDVTRLRRAFSEVDYVIHAAALKQVPAAEYNPSEFVKTNVGGAQNIIDAALDAKVEKVIGLSTDKAVNPVNLYGATKLCSDKLLISANAYSGKSARPIFSVVRYGNVLGSRGSLLPHWKRLIDQGEKEVPITDKGMTRFWITLSDAVENVLNALISAKGGEIFIPKMKSVKIVDLARAFCPKQKQKICGIRPGEKIHEVLISQDDSRETFEEKCFFVNIPIVTNPAYSYYKETKKVTAGFSYTSDNNPELITDIKEIQTLIETVEFEK